MERADEKGGKLKGTLRLYVRWPLIFAVFIALCAAGMFLIDKRAGLAASIVAIICVAAALAIRFYNQTKITNDMIYFAISFGQVQKQLLKGLPLPYAILDENGRFVCTRADEGQTSFGWGEHRNRILPERAGFQGRHQTYFSG